MLFLCAADFTAEPQRSCGTQQCSSNDVVADTSSFILALTSTGGCLSVTDTFIMMDWQGRHWLLLMDVREF